MAFPNKSYDFDIDRIVNYLAKFRDELPKLYQWNANIDKLIDFNILTTKEVKHLNTISPFEKELILKEKVNYKLHELKLVEDQSFYELCLWIIKDWGGIRAAKEEKTIPLIKEFLNSDNPIFKRIASLSKVGSYMYPNKYIIYDSRVAYSLNWILLAENASNRFFPIPEGRNSKMLAFDMNVLIRMKNSIHYEPNNIQDLDKRQYINKIDKSIYIPPKQAYSELNKLIAEVHKRLWNGDYNEKLYYTEMLLFAIADREIFQDITDRIKFSIH